MLLFNFCVIICDNFHTDSRLSASLRHRVCPQADDECEEGAQVKKYQEQDASSSGENVCGRI